jgi:hypothetical protein
LGCDAAGDRVGLDQVKRSKAQFLAVTLCATAKKREEPDFQSCLIMASLLGIARN